MKEVLIRGKSYSISVVNKKELQEDYGNYKKLVLEISARANQYPEKYVDRWLELSDLLIIVMKEEEPIAFSIAGLLMSDEAVMYFPATMVANEYQKNGIAGFLWKKTIKELSKIIVNPVNCLKPAYIVFRTQNPHLYEILSKKLELFPKLNKANNLRNKEIELIKKCSDLLWPKKVIDLERLIIRDAYKESPDLVFAPEKINWADSEEINAFFEKTLKLSKKGIDAFLIFGKIKHRGVLTLVN